MAHNTKAPNNYFLPAEWSQQDGVMLTWPDATTDWKPYIKEITQTYIALAIAITAHERLLIATQDVATTREILSAYLSDDAMKKASLYHCDINDTWARDHGPITLSDNNGSFALLDFKFNGWGDKFAWEKDNAITRSLFDKDAFNAKLIDDNDFVLEGGSIESDGEGTIFTTSQCLLAQHRNQPKRLSDIERELLIRLNAKRIVWLHHGNLIGDDTDGHIDTIVRICPNDTLLYVGCDNKYEDQYEDFKELEKEIKCLRTLDGKQYRLLKLPMPDQMTYKGERLPATYANFLIINDAIIVPTYKQEEKDQLAKNIISKAFPDREIIAVDASIIVRQHGSIHCLTMQLPKGCMK